jgi:6-pyruvoyl tetrahydropterin synthase/QueD family protein
MVQTKVAPINITSVMTPQERNRLIASFPSLERLRIDPQWHISTVSKEYEINAAHWLPPHEGKCHFVHGHNYTFVVKVTGWYHERGRTDREFFVVEFGVLSDILKNTIGEWDHKILAHYTAEELDQMLLVETGESVGLTAEFGLHRDKIIPLGVWTTAENLARVAALSIAARLDRIYPEKMLDVEVTCWETPRTSASYVVSSYNSQTSPEQST